MLPQVLNGYNLPADNGTSIVNVNAATTGPLTLATTNVTGSWQRRLVITSSGNDSSIFFRIIGTNQAGFPITEFVQGGNATAGAVTSTQDFLTVKSIQPSASSVALTTGTTAATVSVGASGTGSSLWNYVNWHVTPTNIEYACMLTANLATFGIQYTYDDPNNLAAGQGTAFAFNHPTLNSIATSSDGNSNDPITAWRLLVSSGTGTIRVSTIQAGISGP